MTERTKKETAPKRVYSNNITVDSDLFKLEVESMQKNMGVQGQKPNIEKIEHCHFYRTFDSSGKETKRCSFVGGHTHEMTVSTDEKGNLIAEASEALGALQGDNHTHKVRYIKSDKIEKRRINTDAQAYIAQIEKI